MKNLAQRIESGSVLGETGTVSRVEGGTFVVRTSGGDLRARRAVSCVVQPETGDFVLVAIHGTGTSHVLAVLDREEGAGARMVLDGDLDLHLGNGRFRVSAQHGVDVVSGERVSVAAAGVDVHAVEGTVSLEKFSFLGTFVQAEVERFKLLAVSVDTVMDRWVQRVQRAYRVVTQTDQLRAGHIDHAAQGSLNLRSRNAVITAQELVKLDAEQVHLG